MLVLACVKAWIRGFLILNARLERVACVLEELAFTLENVEAWDVGRIFNLGRSVRDFVYIRQVRPEIAF